VEVLVPPERVFDPCLSSASSSEFFFSNSEPMHLSSRLSVYPKWDGVNWGTKERILTSLQEIGKLDEPLQPQAIRTRKHTSKLTPFYCLENQKFADHGWRSRFLRACTPQKAWPPCITSRGLSALYLN
jgi:hypothetical protein